MFTNLLKILRKIGNMFNVSKNVQAIHKKMFVKAKKKLMNFQTCSQISKNVHLLKRNHEFQKMLTISKKIIMNL